MMQSLYNVLSASGIYCTVRPVFQLLLFICLRLVRAEVNSYFSFYSWHLVFGCSGAVC